MPETFNPFYDFHWFGNGGDCFRNPGLNFSLSDFLAYEDHELLYYLMQAQISQVQIARELNS